MHGEPKKNYNKMYKAGWNTYIDYIPFVVYNQYIEQQPNERYRKMAKYTIKHICGCKSEVELFGKNDDRKNRIAYLETTTCAKCRAEEKAQESGAKWVEMPYGEYKNNYSHCDKMNYNPKTKSIMVLVAPETNKQKAEAELKALGIPEKAIENAFEVGRKKYTETYVNLVERTKGQELPAEQQGAKEMIEKIIRVFEKYDL